MHYSWCYEFSKVGTFFLAHPVDMSVNLTLKKFHGCDMTEKGLNIDQIIKDSSHRTIKKLQFLSCPLYNYCHGIENPQYLFENLSLITLGRGEPLIACCSV